MCGHNGCGKPCIGCRIVAGIITLILTLTTVVAVVGVYMTHVTPTGYVFGTVEASFALVTLILSLMAWYKVYKKMCPCSMGGAAAGCHCGGAACDCGDGKGDCGHGNCDCK